MGSQSSHFQSVLIGVITLLFGAIIGIYFDSIKGRYNENIGYIDLKVHSVDNYIKIPSLAKNKLNILWEGKDVDNISTLTLRLYNFSKKDFDNVEFIVELIPEKNSELKVIASQLFGEGGRKDMINKSTNIMENGRMKLFFTSEIINRTIKSKPNVVITFLVAGKIAPTTTVFAKKKGVKIREYDSGHADFFTDIEISLLIMFVIFLILVIFIRWQAKKEKALYHSIAKSIEQKMITDDVLDKINSPVAGKLNLRDIIHEIRLHHWDRCDWADKIFKPRPKLEDL